jgi:hypothetical protein
MKKNPNESVAMEAADKADIPKMIMTHFSSFLENSPEHFKFSNRIIERHARRIAISNATKPPPTFSSSVRAIIMGDFDTK